MCFNLKKNKFYCKRACLIHTFHIDLSISLREWCENATVHKRQEKDKIFPTNQSLNLASGKNFSNIGPPQAEPPEMGENKKQTHLSFSYKSDIP